MALIRKQGTNTHICTNSDTKQTNSNRCSQKDTTSPQFLMHTHAHTFTHRKIPYLNVKGANPFV